MSSADQPAAAGRTGGWVGRNGPFVAAAAIWAAMLPATFLRSGGALNVVLYDDAMISMSYARTLARTGELVWYDGAPRVEGFSNPAWTAVMWVFHAVGIPDRWVGFAVQLVGLGLVLAAIHLCGVLARRLDPDRPGTATMARWALALFIPQTYWAVVGMEVPVAAVVLLAVTVALLDVVDPRSDQRTSTRAWLVASLWLALGSVVRLDLLVLAAPLVLGALIAVGVRRWRYSWPLAICLFAVVGQQLLRHWYYGEWVPNTFKLKGVGADLPEQMGSGVLIVLATLCGALLPLVALVTRAAIGRRIGREGSLFAGICGTGIAAIAYVIYIGGDFMDPGAGGALGTPNRFFSTVVPVLMPVAAMGAVTVARTWPTTRRPAATRAFAVSGVSVALVALASMLWLGFWATTAAVAPQEIRQVALQYFAIASIAGLGVAVSYLLRAPRGMLTVLAVACISWVNVDTVRRVGVDRAFDGQLGRAAIGLALSEATAGRPSIAVNAAGSMVYFSGLPAIDQLGKMDPVIASGPVLQRPFIAGHSKWDTQRSLIELEPDIIVEQWGGSPAIPAQLMDRGYISLGELAGGPAGGPLVAPGVRIDAVELCARLASTRSACLAP